MQFPKITRAFNKGVRYVNTHSPEILLGMGLASGATSLYLTISGTIKAVRAIDSKPEKPRGKELVKTVWKYYIPAFLTAGTSAACFVGMHKIQAQRNAALAAAYAASNSALLEYQNKVVEKIGEKEEQEIRNDILEDKVKEKPVTDLNVDVIDPYGEVVYDSHSDKYLRVNLERIYMAVATISKRLLYDSCSLNEYYDLIGWKYQEIGDVYGWPESAEGVNVKRKSVVAVNGEAVLWFEFDPAPIVGYDSYRSQ